MKGWFGRIFLARKHNLLDIVLMIICVRIAEHNIFYGILFGLVSALISGYLSDRVEVHIDVSLEGDSET